MWFILSVGNKNPTWLEQSLNFYSKRIVNPHKLKFINCVTQKKSQNDNQTLIANIPKQTYIIGLDPLGKKMDTLHLANYLARTHFNFNKITFIVGGAYGLNDEIKNKCHQLLSLSDLTFTHKLASLVITEQLYRCSCILSGHPYHKE